MELFIRMATFFAEKIEYQNALSEILIFLACLQLTAMILIYFRCAK